MLACHRADIQSKRIHLSARILSGSALVLSLMLTACGGGGGGGGTSSTTASSTPATATYVAGAFPNAVAIDSAGNAWVVNGGKGTAGTAPGDANVMKLSSTGTVLATDLADGSGQNIANGIAIDGSGNVWVLTNTAVTKLSASGTLINSYTTGSSPTGIAIDSAGNVWVANMGNGTVGTGSSDSNIVELSSTGALLHTYTAGAYPYGIAIDSAGNVWVANRGNGTVGNTTADSNVMELNSTNGTTLGIFQAGSYPQGIAIDASGNVWVANWGNGTAGTASGDSNIMKLTSSNPYIYSAGSHPYSVAIDGSGNVWVANEGYGTPGTATGDSNVMELSPSGTLLVTDVAGSNPLTGSLPYDLAIDGNGNVWVANAGSGTVGSAAGDSNVTEFTNTGATGVPTPLVLQPK